MLALVTSPAIKTAFDLKFRRETHAAEADKVARLIANLHGTLVQPDAAPGTAVAAKRMLLSVLERTKGMRLPFMLVPPIAARTDSPASEPHVESPEADGGTCRRPVALLSAQSSDLISKSPRASSSPRFRANYSPIRRAHATSPRLTADRAASRGAGLHAEAN